MFNFLRRKHEHEPAWILRGDTPPELRMRILGCGICGETLIRKDFPSIGDSDDLPAVDTLEKGTWPESHYEFIRERMKQLKESGGR